MTELNGFPLIPCATINERKPELLSNRILFYLFFNIYYCCFSFLSSAESCGRRSVVGRWVSVGYLWSGNFFKGCIGRILACLSTGTPHVRRIATISTGRPHGVRRYKIGYCLDSLASPYLILATCTKCRSLLLGSIATTYWWLERQMTLRNVKL